MSGSRFVFCNGMVSQAADAPPVKVLLEANPGAYTTSRTHNNASCLLFWERHMKRLPESIRILSISAPELLFKSYRTSNLFLSSGSLAIWQSAARMIVNDSLRKVLPIALKERSDHEEFSITTLVSGNLEELHACEIMDEENVSKILNVNVHVETCIPPVFGIPGNGARLAVVGRGRDVAAAKYSDWVRVRKSLEKRRPPSVTELLLSNDGNKILEGCLTNFFVVCYKDDFPEFVCHSITVVIKEWDADNANSLSDFGNKYPFEVQTAPISAGVLAGTIRQVVIEVCKNKGIPVREVAPSWSEHELWQEAFITNSLRLLQHVDSIQVPIDWQSVHSKTWMDISWGTKEFQGAPGMITTIIQEQIMEKATLEGYPISNLYEG